MKKIILTLSFFVSIGAMAQVDSLQVNSPRPFRLLTIDAEQYGVFIKYNCEDIFDAFKQTYRDGSLPPGNEVNVCPNPEYRDLIALYRHVRFKQTPSQARTLDSLRANQNPFLNRKFDEIDAEKIATDQADRLSARILYRRREN